MSFGKRTPLFIHCFFWASIGSAIQSQLDCQAVPTIYPKTSLRQLAELYFGDPDYQYALLLATNARTAQGFHYLSHPNQLPLGYRICVPHLAEAERLKFRFETYSTAVRDMVLAEPWERSYDLVPIDPFRPVKVVSWIREEQANIYRQRVGKTFTTTTNVWVTLAPHLQDFCSEFVNGHGADPSALNLRLEQRLGLPPNSAKTSFVEFRISDPDSQSSVFRPCESPDVTTTTCKLGPPKECPVSSRDSTCHRHRDFFADQYYASFGVSHPTQFPWTSLGYTFDWALDPSVDRASSHFVEFGESEYVVPRGAMVTVELVMETNTYCAPKMLPPRARQ